MANYMHLLVIFAIDLDVHFDIIMSKAIDEVINVDNIYWLLVYVYGVQEFI